MPKVQLKYPIQAHGEEVTELEFRRLTAGDLVKADGLGEMAMAAKLIELSAQIPPSSVAKLDLVDFQACSAVIAGFIEGGRPTGG